VSRDPTFPPRLVEERRLDRRRFLCAAGAATALAVCGELLAHGLGEPETPEGPVRLPGPLAPGEACSVPAAGGAVLAVRLDADTVVAYDRRCPHLGCPVVWAAARGRFECPCHRAAFDAHTGAVLFGPPRRGLRAVAVEGPTERGRLPISSREPRRRSTAA
jgi:Rieske Fe-S protein